MPSEVNSHRDRRRLAGRRRYAIGAVTLAIGAIALAGCSSSGSSTNTSSSAAAGGSSLTVKQAPGGTSYVADGAGNTLYMLSSETNGQSTCSGQCAAIWPPVPTATAGSGVTGAVTTLKRSDGTSQVVLNGHPLYTFKMDTAPGQINGEGVVAFGGTWTVVDQSGNSVKSLSGSSSGSSGGGGY